MALANGDGGKEEKKDLTAEEEYPDDDDSDDDNKQPAAVVVPQLTPEERAEKKSALYGLSVRVPLCPHVFTGLACSCDSTRPSQKPAFPVRLGSFTCSQTRRVGCACDI